MNRTYGKALIRIFALFSGLVVAVALSGCGGAGEVGTIEEETSSTSDDVPGREKANRDGVQEEPTSEEAPDADDEESSAPDSGADDSDENATEEETHSDEFSDDGGGGESDDSAGEEGAPHTFTGTGLMTTEAVHLEGDYTITYSVTGNTLEDMESNFIADLVNVDDLLDFHVLVNDIGAEVSGTTNVYDLDGDYYVEVLADGDWSFEFTPQ